MGWRETGILDERLRFIVEVLRDEETMTALCSAFGISRKTGYKWVGRYEAFGPQGLLDLPRAPLHHGRATEVDLVEKIVAQKEAHPLWGPKKIVARLRLKEPEALWPAPSTAGAILKRHGLVKGRSRARWRGCGTGPFAPADAANVVWSADHKGWFRTRDGKRCEPLTVMDTFSRAVLGLEALGSTGEDEAWPVFERLFGGYGLPERLRTDNGPPFASAGVSGLTPLSVRFVKLGIALERIDPGKPQQNGRHERFHLTMLPLARAPQADRHSQQQAFDAFRAAYNNERPHEALGQTTPASHYVKSPRLMPTRMPEPDYPPHAAVRQVRCNGEIKWRGSMVYVAKSLAGEPVAIEETEAGEWALRFYKHTIGVIDERRSKLRRQSKTGQKSENQAAHAGGEP
jgi:putative transposase